MNLIYNVIMTLFQTFASTTAVLKFCDIKSNKDKIIFRFITFIYLYLTLIYVPNELRYFVFVIISSFLIKFILKEDNAILYSFISTLLLTLSEIIISILLVILGIDSILIVKNQFYNMIANIFISILTVIFTYFKFLKIIISKLKLLFEKKASLSKYLYLLFIVIYLLASKNGLEFILKSNYYINISQMKI